MKNYQKILSLVICLVLLLTVVAFAVSAETAPTTYILRTNKTLDWKNGASAVNGQQETKIESNVEGNHWYTKVSVKPGFTKLGSASSYWSDSGDNKAEGKFVDAGFAVYDFDLCTADNYIPISSIFAKISAKPQDGKVVSFAATKIGSVDASGVAKFSIDGKQNNVQLNTEPYGWQHWTIIYDLVADNCVVFIDDLLVHKTKAYINSATNIPTYFGDMRIQFADADVKEGGGSVCIANQVHNLYAKDSYIDDITTGAVEGSTLSEFNPADYELVYDVNTYAAQVPENMFEVGGKTYRTFEQALLHASEGTINLLGSWTSKTHVITADCTVNTNGYYFDYDCTGYTEVKNENTISFSESMEKFNVKFADGGNVISEKLYPVGSEIEVPVLDSKIVDGKSLVFFGWSETENGEVLPSVPVASKDVTYYAVYIEAGAIVTDKDGNVKKYAPTDALDTIIKSATSGSTIVLYKDFTLPQVEVEIRGEITIDLNGHTVVAGNRFAVKSKAVFNIKNGTIEENNSNTVFYLDKDKTTGASGDINADNITFNTCGALVDTRAGIFNLSNSIVNFKPGRGNLITVGYRGTNHTVNIKNTEIHNERGDKHFINAGQKEVAISNVTFSNVFIEGNYASLGDINNTRAGAAFNITFDKDCKFDTNNGKFNYRSTANGKFIIEAGVETNELLYNVGSSPMILGTGTGVGAKRVNSKFAYVIADKADTSLITWKVGEKETQEVWLNGELPTVPVTPDVNYTTDTPVVPANGDKVYVVTIVIEKIDLLQNMTLNGDFTFNVYVKDVNSLKKVSINGINYDNFTVLDKWNGYIVFSVKGINPINAANDINVEIVDASGAIETYTLSILTYAEGILNGEHSNEAKALMADTINYIDKAYIAYEKTEDPAYKNLDAVRELAKKYMTSETVPTTDVSMSAVASAITSAQLKLDTSASIRFNLDLNYSGTIMVSYVKDGKNVVDTYTAEYGFINDNDFFEVNPRAFDLTKDIKITVTLNGKTATGTYNLASYVESQKANAPMSDLATAIYRYAKSAEAFKAYIAK